MQQKSTGNLTSNNLILNGKINNVVTNQNLLSLDTATSIQTQLNTKANDNQVVHNSGNESISGVKTFQNNMIVPSIMLNNSDLGTRLTTDETNIATNTNNIVTNTANIATNTLNINNLNNNYKINADNTLPYITTELSRNNGMIVFDNEILSSSLNSNNVIQSLTQKVGLTNQYSLNTSTYRHTSGNDWQSASMKIQNKIDNTNACYLEFNPKDNLFGMNIFTGGNYGMSMSSDGKVKFNSSNSTNIDMSGNIKCNEIYINTVDSVYGNNTQPVGLRINSLAGITYNNIDLINTNTNDIATLQNTVMSLQTQLNAVIENGIKVWGRWNRDTNTIDIGNQYISSVSGFGYQNINDPYFPVVQGVKISLNSNIANIKGIVMVSSEVFSGYVTKVYYPPSSTTSSNFTFVVQCQGGGANPSVQNNSFYFCVI